MVIDFNILLDSSLFGGIDPETLSALLEGYHKITSYEKGETVAIQGSRCKALMIILRGTVRCDMTDATGKMVTISTLSASDILAPAFLYADHNCFPVNITATSELSVLAIGRENFSRLLQQNITLLNNYLRMISNHTQFLSGKIRFLQFGTIKSKLAAYFLDKSTASGSLSFSINDSQQALADLFGVTRPALARAIGEMNENGIISMEKKRVTIHDIHTINNLCSQDR
jgi:CRP-like cAMP-binding protein